MNKVALYIGGFPPGGVKDNTIEDYFEKKNYDLVSPSLFDSKEEFNLDTLVSICEDALDGKEPNVITGLSLGGLVVPHIALKYPNAKLIFSDTGLYFKPKSSFFYFLLRLQNKLSKPILINLVFSLPKWVANLILRNIYKFSGNRALKAIYEENVPDFLSHVLSISPKRALEIIKFTMNIDNSELLKNIKNKSLIISSEKDLLMPPDLGKKLAHLLENSTFYEVPQSHLHFVTPEQEKLLNEFLA